MLLTKRPRVIVLNKIDVPDGHDLAEITRLDLEQFGWPIHEVLAVTHEGPKKPSFTLARLALEHQVSLPELEAARPVIRPKAVDSREAITVRLTYKDGEEVYQVRDDKPERWVRQTDPTNDGAVNYLADQLVAVGVEDALIKAGTFAGDTVVIGDLGSGIVFDWGSTLTTGPELLGQRGTDLHIEQSSRPTHKQKCEVYHQITDAKSAAREELWTERQQGIWTDPDVEKSSK